MNQKQLEDMMALALIICEGPCNSRVSPATALKEVEGKIWCIDCHNRQYKPIPQTGIIVPLSNLPKFAPPEDRLLNMFTTLVTAGWLKKLSPGMSRAYWLAQNSYYWDNRQRAELYAGVEIFEDGSWYFFMRPLAYSKTGIPEVRAAGPYELWASIWANMIRPHSPKP